MIIREIEGGKEIIIPRSTQGQKGLMLANFLMALIGIPICVSMFFQGFESVYIIGMAVVLFYLCVRTISAFGGKAFGKDILRITPKGFELKKSTSASAFEFFPIESIHNFRFLPKSDSPDHPLYAGGYDYLGFQTESKVIQEVIGDNRIAFTSDGKVHSFAENFHSWDFEEITDLIKKITGVDLVKSAREELLNNLKSED